jgi:hypothetical protein
VTASLSGDQIVVLGDNSGNIIRADVVPGGEFTAERISYLDRGTWVVVGLFYINSFHSMRIDSGTGNDTVNIDGVVAPCPLVTINGDDGRDVVNLNSFAPGTVNVLNGGANGYTDLNVTDPDGNFERATVTVGSTSLTLAHPNANYVVNYTPTDLSRLNLNLGNRGNTVTVNDTPSSQFPGGLTTSINTNRTDQVNVRGNHSALTIAGHNTNTVTLGNAGRVNNILAPVSVTNSVAFATSLTVDNSADTGNRTVTLGPTQISFGGPGLSYPANPLLTLRLLGGTGTSTYTITGTPNTGADSIVHLVTRGNGDRVRVLANAARFAIDGLAPNRVEVGDNGHLTNIFRDVIISSSSVATDLVSDNSADTIGRTVTITGAWVSYGNPNAVLRYNNLASLTVRGGSGGDTFNVLGTVAGATTTINGGAGNDTFQVGQNNVVAFIQGPLVLDGGAGSNTVVIDDSADPTPPAGPVTFSNDVNYGLIINGLAPAGIYLGAGQNTTLNTSLRTGVGDKTFNLQAAPQGVALSLDAGTGTNTLDYTGYAGNVLANLQTAVATGFSNMNRIQNVTGASGGPAGSYNILVGNGGNTLTGGTGRRNLLIAGGSASTLIGGDQDDILIGGTTAYDTEAGMASLQAIMAYWAGSADDYATRVNNLTTGNGVPLLDATTVTSNGGGNTLTGGPGLDLFYGNLALDTYDWDPATETFVSV